MDDDELEEDEELDLLGLETELDYPPLKVT